MANILVVDGDESIRNQLQAILNDKGYAARSAEEMETAQLELKQNDMDVVIAGVISPSSNGLDVIKSIRAVAPYAQIILMTDDLDSQSVSQALSQGAFDCLAKPPCEDAIIKSIDHAVKIKTLEDQNRTYRKKLDSLAAEQTREVEESEATVRALLESMPLETAIEQSPESIVITNKNGAIQYVNPAFEKITGYDRREIIGKNPRFLKSGKQDKAFYAELWRTLIQGEVWRGRFINQKRDGTLFEEDASITPVKNTEGKVTHYVAVKRDVTEEVRLKAQLQQAQKMEAMGILAGGIAHDFNNILYPIIGYAEICVEDLSKDSTNRKYVQEILTAARRAQDLVRQILLLSRQTSEERKPLQIKLILKEILKLIRASMPSTIIIRQNVDSDSLIVADPVEIHQILMNLFTNAYHAMREQGGILEIALSDASLTHEDVSLNKRLKPGPYIKLEVRDTGLGMSPLLIERIFEPYYTTKENNEGTGLGLSMVHGIVTSLKGEILVSSEIGEGTTFTVYIPRIVETIHETEVTAVSDLPTGTERILVVDDERIICKMVQKVLQRLGYRVTPFTDSLAALDAFEKAPDDFDFLITDMTMPMMTGVELAQKVLRTRPEFPILLITGYSHLVTEEMARSCGVRKIVMKPIIKKNLAQAVYEALGKSS